MNDFAELLRRQRNDAGLTQAGLAQVIGVTHSAVARWEAGTRLPTPEMVGRMSDAFPRSLHRRLMVAYASVRSQTPATPGEGGESPSEPDGEQKRTPEPSTGFPSLMVDLDALDEKIFRLNRLRFQAQLLNNEAVAIAHGVVDGWSGQASGRLLSVADRILFSGRENNEAVAELEALLRTAHDAFQSLDLQMAALPDSAQP